MVQALLQPRRRRSPHRRASLYTCVVCVLARRHLCSHNGLGIEQVDSSLTNMLPELFSSVPRTGTDSQVESKIMAMLQSLSPESRRTLVQVRDSNGQTLLHLACLYHVDLLVHLLLEWGADWSAVDGRWGATPLHLTAMSKHASSVAVMQHLHDYSIQDTGSGEMPLLKVDALDTAGCTALHYAAYSGDADAVSWLLEAGATPGVQNKDGQTPMFYAGQLNRTKCQELLQEYAASPGDGGTASPATAASPALSGEASAAVAGRNLTVSASLGDVATPAAATPVSTKRTFKRGHAPEGWHRYIDPSSGWAYYAHPATGEAVWEAPEDEEAVAGFGAGNGSDGGGGFGGQADVATGDSAHNGVGGGDGDGDDDNAGHVAAAFGAAGANASAYTTNGGATAITSSVGPDADAQRGDEQPRYVGNGEAYDNAASRDEWQGHGYDNNDETKGQYQDNAQAQAEAQAQAQAHAQQQQAQQQQQQQQQQQRQEEEERMQAQARAQAEAEAAATREARRKQEAARMADMQEHRNVLAQMRASSEVSQPSALQQHDNGSQQPQQQQQQQHQQQQQQQQEQQQEQQQQQQPQQQQPRRRFGEGGDLVPGPSIEEQRRVAALVDQGLTECTGAISTFRSGITSARGQLEGVTERASMLTTTVGGGSQFQFPPRRRRYSSDGDTEDDDDVSSAGGGGRHDQTFGVPAAGGSASVVDPGNQGGSDGQYHAGNYGGGNGPLMPANGHGDDPRVSYSGRDGTHSRRPASATQRRDAGPLSATSHPPRPASAKRTRDAGANGAGGTPEEVQHAMQMFALQYPQFAPQTQQQHAAQSHAMARMFGTPQTQPQPHHAETWGSSRPNARPRSAPHRRDGYGGGAGGGAGAGAGADSQGRPPRRASERRPRRRRRSSRRRRYSSGSSSGSSYSSSSRERRASTRRSKRSSRRSGRYSRGSRTLPSSSQDDDAGSSDDDDRPALPRRISTTTDRSSTTGAVGGGGAAASHVAAAGSSVGSIRGGGPQVQRPPDGWSARRLRGLMWVWRRQAVRVGLLASLYRRHGFSGDHLRRMVVVSSRTSRPQRSPAQLLHIWRQAARRVGSEAVLRRRRACLASAAAAVLARTRANASASARKAADRLSAAQADAAALRETLAGTRAKLEAVTEEVRALRAQLAADTSVDTDALRVAKEVAETRGRQADEALAALRRSKAASGKLQEINKQLMAALLREQAARRKTHNELEEALGKVRMYVARRVSTAPQCLGVRHAACASHPRAWCLHAQILPCAAAVVHRAQRRLPRDAGVPRQEGGDQAPRQAAPRVQVRRAVWTHCAAAHGVHRRSALAAVRCRRPQRVYHLLRRNGIGQNVHHVRARAAVREWREGPRRCCVRHRATRCIRAVPHPSPPAHAPVDTRARGQYCCSRCCWRRSWW